MSLYKWMAGIITRPIDHNSAMIEPVAEDEAVRYITPSRRLTAAERIQIYNQQYWWRLFTALHDNFPLLTRLFGYTDFNRTIAMPFLLAHPPSHWSLAKLGELLPSWLAKTYIHTDKELVHASATLDWAHQELFLAAPPGQAPSLTDKCHLHCQLFHYPFDLMSFRKALLLESVDYWSGDASFPPLTKGSYYIVLYRSGENLVVYEQVSEGEWTFLEYLSSGLSLEEASLLVEKKNDLVYEEAQRFLHRWVQKWIAKGYLYV